MNILVNQVFNTYSGAYRDEEDVMKQLALAEELPAIPDDEELPAGDAPLFPLPVIADDDVLDDDDY